MRPMLSMLIFPTLGNDLKRCPHGGLVVDIGGVRQGVYELLQPVYTTLLGDSCGFASILNLNFGFSNLRGRAAPMEIGINGARQGVSELLQAIYTKL